MYPNYLYDGEGDWTVIAINKKKYSYACHVEAFYPYRLFGVQLYKKK